MKKIITMALVLVMAFGLAAPALAYTTNEAPAQGASPYTVDMYLVEHVSSDILSGWITAPPTDRGYAKNEIIAGIGALNVPANYDVYEDAYRAVRFMPKNVNLDVVDNIKVIGARTGYILNHTVPDVLPGGAWATVNEQWNYNNASPQVVQPWVRNADNGNLTHAINAIVKNANNNWSIIPLNTSAKTYRFLVFGKVTADDAKLTFSLTRNEAFTTNYVPNQAAVQAAAGTQVWNAGFQSSAPGAATVPGATTDGILPVLASGTTGYLGSTLGAPPVTGLLVLNEDILVGRAVEAAIGANRYYVMGNPEARGIQFRKGTDVPEDVMFIIDTGARGKTTALYMTPNGAAGKVYRIHVEPSTQELVFIELTSNGWWNQIKFGSTGYAPLRSFYDQWFEGALGFTAFNEGNLLNASDWHALAAAAWDVTETVDIEPWTPYVSVPENIVTDPPKTGDVSVMGFVLIALAAAAAVVVKKVRA